MGLERRCVYYIHSLSNKHLQQPPQYFQNKPCTSPCLSFSPNFMCTPLQVYDPVWCSSFMCQLDWATGYPTQTTGQIASWVCQWGCFGMRLTFRSADWGQQSALCVRQGSPEKQKLHWLEGLWRLRNPKIWSPVQEQDKNHVPDSYPFFFLPCQSDQEKPPREWGNQVDVDSFSNLLHTCQVLGTRNKPPRPSAVHTAQEESLCLEKETLSTHWLYIIFY